MLGNKAIKGGVGRQRVNPICAAGIAVMQHQCNVIPGEPDLWCRYCSNATPPHFAIQDEHDPWLCGKIQNNP